MITHRRLLSLLDYDPITGIFTWKKGNRAGQVAASEHGSGYLTARVDRRQYFLHRLAWFYVYGTWPIEIDHRDLVKYNNWIDNLRDCSRSANMGNIAVKRHSASGLKGVDRTNSGKFSARIRKDGVRYYLGSFETPGAASLAYQVKAVELFGEFARAT